VASAGIGYRVLSTTPSTGDDTVSIEATLASQLLYGGRYTAVPGDMSGGISVAGVAATGAYVKSQIDYYSTLRRALSRLAPVRR
jgi:hypothetical protein